MQVLSRGGRPYRYPAGRNMQEVPGMAGGMFSLPYDMGTMPVRDAGISQAIPIGELASALAKGTPEQQRTVCHNNLFCFYSNSNRTLRFSSNITIFGFLCAVAG